MAQYGLAFNGDAGLRKWLNKNKAHVNDLSKDRHCTLLYTAARGGHLSLCEMLVNDFGADVKVTNGSKGGSSNALHGACYGGHHEVVRFILTVLGGADLLEKKNEFGETPRDNAASPADDVKKADEKKCIALLDNPPPTHAVAKKAPASEEQSGGENGLSGKTIVFTGTLNQKRADAKSAAEDAGAKVTAAISGKTDIVVAGAAAGEKLAVAKGLGVAVWTEDEFNAAVSSGSAPTTKKAVPEKLAGKKKASKDDDESEADVDDEEAPPKKAAKTEAVGATASNTKGTSSTSGKYSMPTLKLSTTKGKPLEGMTIVFSGSFGKSKKADMENRATALGAAKVAGSVSGKTSLLVLGANAGDKRYDAVREGCITWTLTEFEKLESTGKGPVPRPVPHWGVPIASAPQLPGPVKDRYLGYFDYLLNDSTNQSTLFFPLRFSWKEKSWSKYNTLGAIGVEAVKGLIELNPNLRSILMNRDQGLNVPTDIDKLFESVTLHDHAHPNCTITCINLASNKLGDEGITATLRWLPKTKLGKIYFYNCGLESVATAKAMVEAVKATPSMSCVEIDSSSKEALQVLCDHNDSLPSDGDGGVKGCAFVVDNFRLRSTHMNKLEKKGAVWGFPFGMGWNQ